METPLQVTFRGVQRSEGLEAAVRQRAEKLDRFHSRIMSCRVVVEAPHQHQRKGRVYRVRIYMTVPGGELVVGRAPAEHAAHQDAYLAIKDAFDDAKRLLEDDVRRRRGLVKRHVGPPHGRVKQLFHDDGYGFLEGEDGRLVYFHRNSIINAEFDSLSVGTTVRFTEEKGDKGPQASTVEVVGKA